MGLLEDDDLFPQAGAVKLLVEVGWADSGAITDVPGFWSVNALKVTVWTVMICCFVDLRKEEREFWGD
jgi:hypothetical protein